MNPLELDAFYDTQLAAMTDQQIQRYKFFADKHAEILKRQLEYTENKRSTVEAHMGIPVRGEIKLEDEQNHLDDLLQHAEAEQKKLDVYEMRGRPNWTEEQGKFAGRTEALYGKIHMDPDHSRQIAEDNASPSIDSVGEDSSQKQLNSSIYKPTPVIMHDQQDGHRQFQQSVSRQEASTDEFQDNQRHSISITTDGSQMSLSQKVLPRTTLQGTPPKTAHKPNYVATKSTLSRAGSNVTYNSGNMMEAENIHHTQEKLIETLMTSTVQRVQQQPKIGEIICAYYLKSFIPSARTA